MMIKNNRLLLLIAQSLFDFNHQVLFRFLQKNYLIPCLNIHFKWVDYLLFYQTYKRCSKGVVAKPGVVTVEAQSVQSFKSLLSDTAEPLETLHHMVAAVKVKRRKPIRRPGEQSSKWKASEVETMLRLLNLHGTDFGMVALQMHKTRDQIKRKYILLEARYKERLNGIFNRQEPKDQELQQAVATLALHEGKDYLF